MAIVEIQHLSKTFGDRTVLKDIDFSVEAGEVVTIIGSSGSGKSTLLRCINLLEEPSGGEIIYRGENILDVKHDVNKYRTHIGMVFQSFNLFNNMDVLANCTVGPIKVLGKDKAETEALATKFLEQVGMGDYVHARPSQLSGGQKQRVALASILALRPDIIILDEATSMLDPNGRQEVIAAIRKIKERFNLTVISITHDLDEASLADRILMMQGGRLVQDKKPEEIFLMGEQLVEQGLDVPFSQKLKDALAARGLDVPDNYLDEEALLTWITPLYSTK